MSKTRFLLYVSTAIWLAAAGSAAQTPAPQPASTPAPPAGVPGVPDEEHLREFAERAREQAEELRAQAIELQLRPLGELKLQIAANVYAAMALQLGNSKHARAMRSDSEDRQYSSGQRALDAGRWDDALASFSLAAAGSGPRADGALYWKAYALSKLGRRDEALAAIAELRKSHPSSRWLNDAGALVVEMKQSGGQKVSPEGETDMELKLMALNGLTQSDPERALPLLEKLLKSSQSPKLKERTVFVLAQSESPRARQLLEQVARGGTYNPDLQVKAINYLGVADRKRDNGRLLLEIYSASNDLPVKRAVLNAFMASRNTAGLLQVVRTDKTQALRVDAIRMLGANGAYSDLVQLYRAEPSAEVREQIVHSLAGGPASYPFLLDLARTERDRKPRLAAIHALGSGKATVSGDALVSLYGSESDAQVKKAIADVLAGHGNAKALVELARKESDPQMKREIVRRLSSMKSKEAADYLAELLK
jgi:HEAT repeat protein